MAYYANGCLIGTNSRVDTNGADFHISSVTTVAGGTGGTQDVIVVLQRNQNGDVDEFVTCGNIAYFDDENDTVATVTDAGPNTTGVPAVLSSRSPDITPSVGNTGNTWKVVYSNLQVKGKDGVTFTIPTLTKTFPSPF